MPTAYAPRPGQLEVDDRAQERVGDLDQDARRRRRSSASAPAAPRWSRLRSAVSALVDDVVAGLAGQGRPRRRRRRRRARSAGRRALGRAGTQCWYGRMVHSRRRRPSPMTGPRAGASVGASAVQASKSGTTLARRGRGQPITAASRGRDPTAVRGTRGRRVPVRGVDRSAAVRGRAAGASVVGLVAVGVGSASRAARASAYDVDSSRPGPRMPAADRRSTTAARHEQHDRGPDVEPQAEDVFMLARCRSAASRSSRGRAV